MTTAYDGVDARHGASDTNTMSTNDNPDPSDLLNHADLVDGGVAGVSESDEEQLARRVRVVPIGEGDVTTGSSGVKTRWTRETLRASVQAGVWQDADLIIGRGGEQPHYDLAEQVPPEAKLGRVTEWTYEDGVGPVGYADIVDDGIADRIELGLLDVSADMIRTVSDTPDADGVFDATEILAAPRVTVLDRGASGSARIEPATIEALGLSPDAVADAIDPDADPDADEPLEGDGDGADPGDDDADDASDSGSDTVGPDGDTYDDADAPANASDRTLLERILAAVTNGGDGAGDTGQETEAETGDDEPAEPGTETTTGNDPDTDQMSQTTDDPTPEQLAEKVARISDLESEVEQLNEQLDSKEDEYEEQLADKDEQIEDLEGQIAPIRELLAEIAAEGSMLSADRVAETHSVDELVDLLSEGADDDTSYADKIREQLGQTVAPQGDADGDAGTGDLSDEDLAQAERLATSVLNVSDLQRMEAADLTAREYLQKTHGVDTATCVDETQVREKIAAADQEQ